MSDGGSLSIQKARWTRTQNGRLRKLLKAGKLDPYRVLEGNNEEWEPIVAPLRVLRVLCMVRGIGERTAEDIVAELGLPAKATMAGLTYERRRQMSRFVRDVRETATTLEEG